MCHKNGIIMNILYLQFFCADGIQTINPPLGRGLDSYWEDYRRQKERGAHVSDVPPYLFYMLDCKMVWE